MYLTPDFSFSEICFSWLGYIEYVCHSSIILINIPYVYLTIVFGSLKSVYYLAIKHINIHFMPASDL